MTMLKDKIAAITREQIYVVLLLLFVASYPVTYNLNARVIIALTVFFLIDSKSNLKNKFNSIKSNKVVIVMALYFLIQVLGLIYTDDLKRGIDIVTRNLPFLLLPAIVLSEKISRKNILKLLDFLKIWMLLVMIYLVLYQYFIEDRTIGTTVHFAFEKLGISQHSVSFVLVIAIMITIHQLFDISIKHKWFNGVILIGLFSSLLLFSSRINVIVLLFSLAVFFYNHYRSSKMYYKILVVFVVFMVGSLSFYGSAELRRKADILLKSTDFDMEIVKTKNSITFAKNTIEQRMMINMASVSIIKEHPVFGVGTGDYLNALQDTYRDMHFIAGMKQKFNAHNQYLEEYIKTGIVGFLTYLFFMITLINYSRKQQSLMLYCVFGIVFISLTESIFTRHHGVAFAAFFIPLFYKNELFCSQLKKFK